MPISIFQRCRKAVKNLMFAHGATTADAIIMSFGFFLFEKKAISLYNAEIFQKYFSKLLICRKKYVNVYTKRTKYILKVYENYKFCINVYLIKFNCINIDIN